MEHDRHFEGAVHPPGDIIAAINALICGFIAGELDTIRDKLELMGENLCNEPVFVSKYIDTLQSIDELSQRHENLARLLRSTDMEAAIDSITLESLRNRLLDAATDHLASLSEAEDSAAAATGASVHWHSV